VINDVLLERRVDAQYVTLTILHWESTTRKFTIANAGANPPMICRDGEILKVKIEGVPAGLLEEREYDQIDFTAKPGDVLLLYSDGITDQLNRNDEEYGRNRLKSVLRKSGKLTPEEIADRILQDFDQFSDGTPAFDDQTLIVVKVSE
jgi:sigma-B regulation protein RsbU (phosphoserine phosphatase)